MSLKSQDIFEVWGAFFLAHALSVKRIDSELAGKASLSLEEYGIMLEISRSAGGARYSALATNSIFTKSGITRLAKRLEKRGLIKRVKCEEDGRGAYAEITASGQKAMQSTWQYYSKAILDLLDPCLTQTDARELKIILEKIIDRAGNTALVQIK